MGLRGRPKKSNSCPDSRPEGHGSGGATRWCVTRVWSAHHAQTRIHVPGTAVSSTGEYLAGQQHRHGRLAAASSDTAAAEISNVKFVLPTPEARVGVGVWQRSAQSGSSSVGLGSWSEFSRPSARNAITRDVLSLTLPRTPALSHNVSLSSTSDPRPAVNS